MIDGYSETPPKSVEYNQNLTPPVSRQTNLGGVWTIRGSFRMTSDQYQTFKDFYKDVLRGGLLKFTARFTGGDVDETYQIYNPFTAQPLGPRNWTINLEVLRY